MGNPSECSLVNTEEKWLLSIEALSASLLYTVSLTSNELIPLVSFQCKSIVACALWSNANQGDQIYTGCVPTCTHAEQLS